MLSQKEIDLALVHLERARTAANQLYQCEHLFNAHGPQPKTCFCQEATHVLFERLRTAIDYLNGHTFLTRQRPRRSNKRSSVQQKAHQWGEWQTLTDLSGGKFDERHCTQCDAQERKKKMNKTWQLTYSSDDWLLPGKGISCTR